MAERVPAVQIRGLVFPWHDIPKVCEIRGERGSGKSTLAAELADAARARGAVVVQARPLDSLAIVNGGLFLDIADALTAALSAANIKRPPALARVRAELFEVGDCVSPDPRSTYVLATAIRELLATIAPPQGLFVIVDDLQWADEVSAQVLEQLVRRPPGGGVCLVVAHRPRQVSQTVRVALEEGQRGGGAIRVVPTPLSDEQACELLPADLDWRHRSQILAECGGNPGLLIAYRDALLRTSVPAISLPTLSPEVLTEALRDFRGLSTAAQRLAWAGTLLPEPFDLERLCVAAEVPAGELGPAVDQLVRHGIFIVAGALRGLRFASWLQRAAAHQSAAPHWLLNARSRAGADMSVGGPVSPAATGAALIEAAERHRWRNAPEAVVWAEVAGAVHGQPPRGGIAVLGSALALSGDLDRAREVLSQPIAVDGTLTEQVEVAVWRAWCEDMLGRPEASAALLTGYCSETGLAAEHHAILLGARCASELRGGQTIAERTIDLLEGLADAVAAVPRAWLLALLARAELTISWVRRARRHAAEAARLLDSEDCDDAVVRHLDALAWLAETELLLEDPVSVEGHVLRGLRIARPRGFRPHTVMFNALLQRLDGGTGRYAELASSAEPGVEEEDPAAAIDVLSSRESEIAVLVSQGFTNQRIARSLVISQKTVETHLGRIFRKLTVSSRAEVAALVGRSTPPANSTTPAPQPRQPGTAPMGGHAHEFKASQARRNLPVLA